MNSETKFSGSEERLYNENTLYNECPAHQEDIMSILEGYIEHIGIIHYIGGYHDSCEGYHNSYGGANW